MHARAYYIINGITLYRLIMAPVLILLVIDDRYELFTWALAVSFFTDAIDGFLSRSFKVTSVFGAKLDSAGDDLTVLAAVVGMVVFKDGFVRQQQALFFVLLGLFLLQTSLALLRYRKMTGFHTYSAKIAAGLQGIFFILLFFLPEPVYPLFYIAVACTFLDLLEEILLVLLLGRWEANVKGIYWILKRNKAEDA
ncbi:MAG: CDP-alcohol phosphatidyltransferase family protein [Chitinophagaceae bacterium]|nr:MAG: CDP-alcohol phosphatidyltransferase family protein [Chitinophagaceae bacterium]